MARLPESFLADIKAIPLAQVLEAGGHELIPAGSGAFEMFVPASRP